MTERVVGYCKNSIFLCNKCPKNKDVMVGSAICEECIHNNYTSSDKVICSYQEPKEQEG